MVTLDDILVNDNALLVRFEFVVPVLILPDEATDTSDSAVEC